MWCFSGDSYSKLEANYEHHDNDGDDDDDEDDEEDDEDDYEIDRNVKKGVNNNNFNLDSPKINQLENHLSNGSNTSYPLAQKTSSKHLSLDTLPKDILVKVASHLDIRDLMCLEHTNRSLKCCISHYWKTFCERSCIPCDPTPLCVGWPLNTQSLYSYDNATVFCQDPIKKWRVAAMRSLLVGSFCCVVCGQHLKDRMSVDGIYFNHDVLLCFPDCFHIFTVNINGPVLKICQKYGIGKNDLLLINSTYPVLLINEFIKTLREMGVDEKELLAEARPYLGLSKETLHTYFDFVEKIRTFASLL